MFKIFRMISTVHTFCNRDLMAKAVSFLHFVESSLTRAADIGIKNIPAWSFKIFYKKKTDTCIQSGIIFLKLLKASSISWPM